MCSPRHVVSCKGILPGRCVKVVSFYITSYFSLSTDRLIFVLSYFVHSLIMFFSPLCLGLNGILPVDLHFMAFVNAVCQQCVVISQVL